MYFRFMGSMDHDCNSVRVVHIFADTVYLKTRMRVYIEALKTMIAIMFQLYIFPLIFGIRNENCTQICTAP